MKNCGSFHCYISSPEGNHQPTEATWMTWALLTCADYPNLRALKKTPLRRHWMGRKHAKATMATPAIKPNLQKGAKHRGCRFLRSPVLGGIHQEIYDNIWLCHGDIMEIHGNSWNINYISPTRWSTRQGAKAPKPWPKGTRMFKQTPTSPMLGNLR